MAWTSCRQRNQGNRGSGACNWLFQEQQLHFGTLMTPGPGSLSSCYPGAPHYYYTHIVMYETPQLARGEGAREGSGALVAESVMMVSGESSAKVEG